MHGFGAQVAEVRVDVDTGEVRVPRLLGVFAVGRIINAKTGRSQLLGGMTMGPSMALHEESVLIMYIVTALCFGLLGGEVLVMRFQLVRPRNTFLTPSAYDQIFTMHGTTMIFLVIMPMLIGFALYFMPLQIGANEIAFPRFDALGYWVFLFGGLLLYYSFLGNGAPDAGWFAYAPLSSDFNFTADAGMNYWAVALLTTGIGTMSGGINIQVTTLTMRAPGMTLRRLPLFTWMRCFQAILIILAIPALERDPRDGPL